MGKKAGKWNASGQNELRSYKTNCTFFDDINDFSHTLSQIPGLKFAAVNPRAEMKVDNLTDRQKSVCRKKGCL